jgi:hypothetical protein
MSGNSFDQLQGGLWRRGARRGLFSQASVYEGYHDAVFEFILFWLAKQAGIEQIRSSFGSSRCRSTKNRIGEHEASIMPSRQGHSEFRQEPVHNMLLDIFLGARHSYNAFLNVLAIDVEL